MHERSPFLQRLLFKPFLVQENSVLQVGCVCVCAVWLHRVHRLQCFMYAQSCQCSNGHSNSMSTKCQHLGLPASVFAFQGGGHSGRLLAGQEAQAHAFQPQGPTCS